MIPEDVLKRGELVRVSKSSFGKTRVRKALYKLSKGCLTEMRISGIAGSPRNKKLCSTSQIKSMELYDNVEGGSGLFGWSIVLNERKSRKQRNITLMANSEEERWMWMKAIEKAQEETIAGKGRSLFAFAHQNSFFSLEASEEEEEDTDEDEDINDETLFSHTLTTSAHHRVHFTTIRTIFTTNTGDNIQLSSVLDLQELEHTLVKDFKKRVVQNLKKKVKSRVNVFSRKHLKACDPDFFVLKLAQDTWMRNEDQSMLSYLSTLYELRDHNQQPNVILSLNDVADMPPPPIELLISSSSNKISDLSQRPYTLYNISVKHDSMQWQVARRFNEFFELNKTLTSSTTAYFPVLPPKQLVTPTEGKFVKKRSEMLQEYLRELLCVSGMQENIHVLSFLGVATTTRYHHLDDNTVRQVLHISSLKTFAQYGDVVLFQCRTGVAKVQRTLTGSSYDHVGIVVPVPNCKLGVLEATGEGIAIYPLVERLRAYAREVSPTLVIRKLSMHRTLNLQKKLSSFLEEVDGNHYSIFGLFKTEKVVNDSELNSPSKGKKYFCSELVASSLRIIGAISKSRASSYFWPGDFAVGGSIEKYLLPGCTIGPEISIDCRILEVSRANNGLT